MLCMVSVSGTLSAAPEKNAVEAAARVFAAVAAVT